MSAPAPTIDRESRAKAANLLRAYASRQITNDALVDGWPVRSTDPALPGIYDIVWHAYSDMEEHLLEPERGSEVVALLHRAAAFLDGEREYKWPTILTAVRLASMATLGILERVVYRRVYRAVRDGYWPFDSVADVPTLGPPTGPPLAP